jgi:hypothetical protein
MYSRLGILGGDAWYIDCDSGGKVWRFCCGSILPPDTGL